MLPVSYGVVYRWFRGIAQFAASALASKIHLEYIHGEKLFKECSYRKRRDYYCSGPLKIKFGTVESVENIKTKTGSIGNNIKLHITGSISVSIEEIYYENVKNKIPA